MRLIPITDPNSTNWSSLAVEPLERHPDSNARLAGVIAIDSRTGGMTPTPVNPTMDPDEAKIVAPIFG